MRALAASLALVLLAACSSSGSSGHPEGGGNGTSVASGTSVLFALPLQVDRSGLAAYAAAAADPASPSYHRFLDVATIADRFGAPADAVQADIATLAHAGVTAKADPTRSALWGTVTAGTVTKVFGTPLTTVESGGDEVIVPAGTPKLPSGLQRVTGAIGFTRTQRLAAADPLPGSSTCPPAGAAADADALASLYGFRSLAGADGHGTTVALFSVGTYQPEDLTTYVACTGAALQPGNVNTHDVPLAPPAPGGTEVALDTLLLQTIAPAAQVRATHVDANSSIVFPLLDLVTDGPPHALAITLGYCERDLSSAEIGLAEWLLATLAAAGTSSVAAAGDDGSAACPPSSSPAVQYPASSAFVVSVGGVQYAGPATSPDGLAVWNEGPGAAGGGGTSSRVDRPPFQHGLPAPGTHRLVPDISVSASPSRIGLIPVCRTSSSCVWTSAGGTSAGAAVLAAAGAVYAQQHASGDQPERWGLLAPSIYAAAADPARVRDVVAGSNATTDTSCCDATTGFDQASGWGLFAPDDVGALFG